MARFDLTDAEWTIIAPLLPGAEGSKHGRPRPDDRKVLNGIFFVLRTGTPWRDLPERYGPYTTVYNRFNRWAKRGHWQAIFEALARCGKDGVTLSIDSTSIKAHRSATSSKRGNMQKRSVARGVGERAKSMYWPMIAADRLLSR